MALKNWRACLVRETDSIMDTLRVIDQAALQVACVVTGEDILCGIVTDGDVRRAILRGTDMHQPVSTIANQHPVVFHTTDEKSYIISVMKRKGISEAPIVDQVGHVVDLLTLETLLSAPERDNIVVLMAGGLGTRLRPLTDKVPKPLLKVGSKPILQTILESFIENGFHRFYFSVNYKAEMIEQYFGDGSRFGVEIHYIHERKRMGTAGALYFLPEKVQQPIIVMNGDLLTKLDFGTFLDYHAEQGAAATMAVREYTYTVPYGVIDYDGERITNIQEKPTQSFYVAAGIYALSPEAVACVDKEAFFDMPDLFNQLIHENRKTTIFPIRDYWMDIGRLDDFHQAQNDYGSMFENK
ncbi:MAG: nucleotidyltransferase family protein [Selenomonadaceae bacterium]|nr:nucleotidyltransferase family protein [Selenomonadaceae bacterium]